MPIQAHSTAHLERVHVAQEGAALRAWQHVGPAADGVKSSNHTLPGAVAQAHQVVKDLRRAAAVRGAVSRQSNRTGGCANCSKTGGTSSPLLPSPPRTMGDQLVQSWPISAKARLKATRWPSTWASIRAPSHSMTSPRWLLLLSLLLSEASASEAATESESLLPTARRRQFRRAGAAAATNPCCRCKSCTLAGCCCTRRTARGREPWGTLVAEQRQLHGILEDVMINDQCADRFKNALKKDLNFPASDRRGVSRVACRCAFNTSK